MCSACGGRRPSTRRRHAHASRSSREAEGFAAFAKHGLEAEGLDERGREAEAVGERAELLASRRSTPARTELSRATPSEVPDDYSLFEEKQIRRGTDEALLQRPGRWKSAVTDEYRRGKGDEAAPAPIAVDAGRGDGAAAPPAFDLKKAFEEGMKGLATMLDDKMSVLERRIDDDKRQLEKRFEEVADKASAGGSRVAQAGAKGSAQSAAARSLPFTSPKCDKVPGSAASARAREAAVADVP